MIGRFWLCALIVALAAPAMAAAQGLRAAAPGPAQTLLQDQNQDLPIQIDAATLEVRDKNKTATFSGDVQVVQGDMTIKCQSLVVFYGAEHGPAANAVASAAPPPGAPPGAHAAMPQGSQDIRRIEARGGVTVISRDQNASGDLGIYDVKKKTITLTGNVVVSQGKNVLRGDRVIVDTVTGDAHIDSNQSHGVRALILPSKGANGGPPNLLAPTLAPARSN